MARPRANPEQHLDAYCLWRDGKGAKDINQALYKAYGNNKVSERTVANWIREFKDLHPKVTDQDTPLQWHLMDQSGLPWEAGALLLNIQFDGNRWGFDPEGPLSSLEQRLPPLTVREARWCWRVHLASREIGSTVGTLSDVAWLARTCAYRELMQEIKVVAGTGQNMDTLMAPVNGLLRYKPWLDFGSEDVRHDRYHRAVEQGIVPQFTYEGFITHSVWQLLQLGERGEDVDVPIPIFSEQHPELLVSQHVFLLEEDTTKWNEAWQYLDIPSLEESEDENETQA